MMSNVRICYAMGKNQLPASHPRSNSTGKKHKKEPTQIFFKGNSDGHCSESSNPCKQNVLNPVF